MPHNHNKTHQQILLNSISFQLMVVSTPQFPDDDEYKFINMLIIPTEAIESNVNNLKIWPALIDPRTSDVTMKFLAKDVGIFPSRLFSLRSNVFRPQLAEIGNGFLKVIARVIYVHSISRWKRQLAMELVRVLGNSCKLQEARLSLLRFGN
ncbi:hypothetical protein ACJIZ3_009124 [Penstemon smallii]|uniref:Uncharacterized protein n=1 Tax=Penstemon smallii TaxID=265156 RepID=A0ABD3TDC1_9LAMI